MRRAAPVSKLSLFLAALTAAVTACLYAPAIGRGFVSEDFLILRCFYEAQEAGRFWATAWQSFTGPWLGLSIVSFFRPLSSLFLQLEWTLFGTFSAGYGVVHLAIHLLNAWQVQDLVRLVRNPGPNPPASPAFETAIPFAAAGIFALYPLHPNTVVFIASFATLLAVGLLLLSLRRFIEGRARGSLLAFIAGLACYEQAAILPAYLLAFEVLRSRSATPPKGAESAEGAGSTSGPEGQRHWRRLILHHLPYWLVLVLYLALRRVLLGHSIGGYPTFRDRFGDVVALLEAMLGSLGRMVFPSYGISIGTLSVGVAAFGLWGLARWALGRQTHDETLALIALSWILISLAPFSFVGVVPGNGRYWYLASCGLALFWCALIQCVTARLRLARPKACLVMGLLVINALYAAMLWPMVKLYREAGETAALIQDALRLEGESRLFVADVPRFLKIHGVPAAQVFHWGLSDALMPPFSPPFGPQVLPLPPLGDHALAPLTALPEGRLLRWANGRATRVEHSLPDELVLRRPQGTGQARTIREQDFGPVAFLDPAVGSQYRLAVIARGSYHLEGLTLDPTPGSEPAPLAIHLPRPLVESMGNLYGRDSLIVWWVEQRKEGSGQLIAVSRPMELRRPI